MKRYDPIILQAISLWGADNQIRQAGEECAEFAVKAFQHGRGRDVLDGLLEEGADVRLTGRAMDLILGEEAINAWVEIKARRLQQRIIDFKAGTYKIIG